MARDGDGTPSSPSTRIVSILLVGSMIRPSTSALKASSPTWSNPSEAYIDANASHTSSDAVPVTTGAQVGRPAPAAESSGSSSCSAFNRTLAASSSNASWPSSCAEPMCSIPSTRRPRFCTIWTAVAPDAVITRRTNEPTR